MTLTFDDAEDADAGALTDLYAETAADLTARFGRGHWSHAHVVPRIDAAPGRARVRVGRCRGKIVTVLRLQSKKPWAIDAGHFTPVSRPLYLVDMAVAVSQQRRGWGRGAMEDAYAVAASWPADAIRLDAYDAPAGAGPFYAKCGYAERGRVVYRGNSLVYYELLVNSAVRAHDIEVSVTPNKKVVERYMDGFRRTDRPQILACLTDDVEWEVPGAFHVRGKKAFDAHIVDDAFEGNPEIAITRMIEAEGVVVAEGAVRTRKKDGTVVNLLFCDVFDMQNGNIRRLVSYLMNTGG